MIRVRAQLLLLSFLFGFFGNCLFAQENPAWMIEANDYTNYTGISVANGRIGILPSAEPGKTKSIILNNVYDKESKFGVSKVLLGINFANIEIVVNQDTLSTANCSNWKQVLNMKSASFATSCQFKEYAEISFTLYALRGMPYSGLVDVK